MKKDLLGIADLTRDEIYLVLDTAEAMREIGERPIKKVPTLRGKTVVNLFYEPSTRTRTSFEIAEKRLSADTLSLAVAASSVLKGETLADTAMNLLSERIAIFGGAQNILTTLQGNHGNVSLSNKMALTDLQSSDLGVTMTELNGYQLALQATYKAYAKVGSLSLFDAI